MQDCPHGIDDLDAANRLLQQSPPTFNEIADVVCRRYKVAARQLASHRNFADISKPRHLLIYLARKLTRLSLIQIGMRLGNRNVATIHDAEAGIAEKMTANEHLRDEIDLLRIAIAERVMVRR